MMAQAFIDFNFYIIHWVKRKQLDANTNIPNIPEWKEAEIRRIFSAIFCHFTQTTQ